jgi:hypothetical protein
MRFQLGYPTFTLALNVSHRTSPWRGFGGDRAAVDAGVVHAQRLLIVHAQRAFLGRGRRAPPPGGPAVGGFPSGRNCVVNNPSIYRRERP